MKRYVAIRHIASASGTQLFEVEANSKEEAFRKFENGEGNFVEEEIEVESLEELTIDDVHEEEQPE